MRKASTFRYRFKFQCNSSNSARSNVWWFMPASHLLVTWPHLNPLHASSTIRGYGLLMVWWSQVSIMISYQYYGWFKTHCVLELILDKSTTITIATKDNIRILLKIEFKIWCINKSLSNVGPKSFHKMVKLSTLQF